MVDLLELQKYFIRGHLGEGDAAADFTMGNGHDTEFLSKTVGPTGRVYAFDIQKSALESTAARLRETGCPDNVTLIHDSHSNAKKHIDRPIRAGMFNLGWLPGGDKSVTTRRETTLPAIADALELLDHGGVLLVAVYPGHAEGEAEGAEVAGYFASLDRHKICASQFRIINSPTSPYFFVVEKK
jgi:predicted methyltransferase